MSHVVRLGPFSGLFSALGGAAPAGFAGSLLNVRVGDGWIRPRYGYRNLATKPVGLTDVYGLARLLGYGDDYLPRLEWVTIEKRGGVVRPYAVDPSTWSRTEITNGGTALSLNAGDWLGFAYSGLSYFVNPGGSPSLYKHKVGDVTSWTAMEDAGYTPLADDPTIDAKVRDAVTRPWLAPPTDTYTDVVQDFVQNTVFTVDGSGNLLWTGDDNDHAKVGHGTVTVVFATALDLSGHDYCGMSASGGVIVKAFRAGTKVEVRIGGAWSTPEQKETLAPDRVTVGVAFRMRGVAGANAVEGIRLTFYGDPYKNNRGTAFTIHPLSLGGTYVGADNVTDRPWDTTYRRAEESYGVRFKNVVLGTYTGIKGVTLDDSRFGTVQAGPSAPLGDSVLVSAAANLQAPYVDDPAGTAYRMEFVRRGLDGKWRVFGDAPNTSGRSITDLREVWEIASPLTEASPGDYVAPDPTPVFASGGFVGGVPFKGWVVWFKQGGRANVQHSRVGDAEALTSPGDDVEDIGRGADFTLADDFADEPLGGVQAGGALLIAGRQGVYGQSGDYPSQMTPPRKAPGSMGCAGRFAFARFRGDGGEYGIAWLDSSGENVWFASTSLVYSTDTQARPIELSSPMRGTLRRFLYDDQKAILPGIALSQARMDVDESTGSLWIVLGQRAAILRPPSMIDGKRQWELSRFTLGLGGTTPIPACTDPYGATTYADVERASSTLAWSNPSNAAPGASVATVGPFLPGLSSHWLQGPIFVSSPSLPAEATITSVRLKVRHRRTSAGTAPTPVVLSAARSGALSLMPNVDVTSEFADAEIDLVALDATPETLNAGIDVGIAYDAVPNDAEAFDPANWTTQVEPNGPTSGQAHGTLSLTVAWTIRPTWNPTTAGAIGKPAPSDVPLSIHSTAHAQGTGGIYPYEGPGEGSGITYATAYSGPANAVDGLGGVNSGNIGSTPIMTEDGTPYIPLYRHSETTAKRTATVIDGVGTLVVTTSAAATVTGPEPQDAVCYLTLAATITSPDPSTVEVESMTLVVCYTVPSADGEQAIA